MTLKLAPLVQVVEALKSRNQQKMQAAADIVQAQTLNVGLMEQLERALKHDCKQWRLDAIDRYNEVARVKREDFHQASAALDQQLIGEASIQEGLWHINGGEYRLAQASFKAAAVADPARELECDYLMVQLDLLKGDWSMVVASTEKSFGGVSARLGESFAREVLLSHALALWQYESWAEAAAVLLHTAKPQGDAQTTQEATQGADPVPRAAVTPTWPWLNAEELSIMCVCCSLTSFDREMLGYLVHGDLQMRAAFDQFVYLRDLVGAFLDVDIPAFWQHWAVVRERGSGWLMASKLESLGQHLKQQLLHNFLSVRTECSFDTLMQAMSVRSFLEMAAEIRVVGYPVQLDAETRVCRVRKPASTVEPAEVFVSDSVATIWHGIEVKYGQGFEHPPARDKKWRREGPGYEPQARGKIRR